MNASDRAEEEEFRTNLNKKELFDFKIKLNGKSSEDCWNKNGGSTEKQWIGIEKKWKCGKCELILPTFLDFV